MEIRWATQQDIAELSQLWLTCFGDSQQFRDWFFARRFWPEYCLTACEDNRPVGAVYGLPTHLWVRGRVIPAVIIGGVSTHPDWRGKGIMHRLFVHFMAELHRRGVPLTLLHPVREDLYFSLEHYTCSDRKLLSLPAAAPRPPLPTGVTRLDFGQREAELLCCYQQYIRPYCGPVWRDEAAFAFKAEDYRAGGAELLAALDDRGEICGYCYYFKEEEALTAEEFVADDEVDAQRLFAQLAHLTGSTELCLKLPVNSAFAPANTHTEQKPWGCMGVGHLPTLLHSLCPDVPGFAIRVQDPVVAENSGVYDLQGRPTRQPPQLSLSAGRLVQWLCGYRSLAQLEQQGCVTFHNRAAALRLDELLPTAHCLCTEDY